MQMKLFEDEIDGVLAPVKLSNEAFVMQESARQSLINQYRKVLRWLAGVKKKVYEAWMEETLAAKPEEQAARGNQLQVIIEQYQEALQWLKGVSKKIHDTWIEETLAAEPEAQAARGNQLKVIYRNRRVTQ